MSWIFMLEMIFTRKQNNFHKKNCLKNKKYFYPVNIFVLLETKKTLIFFKIGQSDADPKIPLGF